MSPAGCRPAGRELGHGDPIGADELGDLADHIVDVIVDPVR